MAHEPIGISPFVSLITGDAKLLITATAGHQYLVGGYLAIVNRVNYLVSIHIHLSISLTHLLYRITVYLESQHLSSTFSTYLVILLILLAALQSTGNRHCYGLGDPASWPLAMPLDGCGG
jgi:hypothetical protein